MRASLYHGSSPNGFTNALAVLLWFQEVWLKLMGLTAALHFRWQKSNFQTKTQAHVSTTEEGTMETLGNVNYEG